MPFENIGVLQDFDVDSKGNLLTHKFGAGNKPVFIMVWGSYCGHCASAKPAFGKLFDKHKQKNVFLATIQTDDDDVTVKKLVKRLPEILSRHGINFSGVPTYLVYQDGEYFEYEGGRDLASLEAFVSKFSAKKA